MPAVVGLVEEQLRGAGHSGFGTQDGSSARRDLGGGVVPEPGQPVRRERSEEAERGTRRKPVDEHPGHVVGQGRDLVR